MNTFRGSIAGLVGGLVGFGQILSIALLDEAAGRNVSIKELWAATVFVVLMCLQIMAVIALSMFRVSPFVARILGDLREAERIEVSKAIRRRTIERASTTIIVLQRIVVAVGAGHVSQEWFLTVGVALFPLALPKRKPA